MADEEYRIKCALLDWQNELAYCKMVLNDRYATDEQKAHAEKRIEEAKKWIAKIKGRLGE